MPAMTAVAMRQTGEKMARSSMTATCTTFDVIYVWNDMHTAHIGKPVVALQLHASIRQASPN